MAKNIMYLTLLLCFTASMCFAQDPVVRFAYKIDKGGSVFILDDAVKNGHLIIVDEFANFEGMGENYLHNKVEEVFKEYPGKVLKDTNQTRYMFYSEGESRITGLSKLPYSKPLYISTATGVYNGNINTYYLSCCEDFMNGSFYPVVNVESFTPETTEDYKRNLYIVSDKAGLTKISFDEETEMSSRYHVFETLHKLFGVSITKGEDTREEITILPGSFTAKGSKQYLVTYRDQQEIDFSGGVFLLDDDFNRVTDVFPFTKKEFYYNKAIGTVDINGDGQLEFIIDNGYYEGAGYELWGYKNGKFERIISGFFFGV